MWFYVYTNTYWPLYPSKASSLFIVELWVLLLWTLIFVHCLQPGHCDVKLEGIMNSLPRRCRVRREHHLHPPPPCFQGRTLRFRIVVSLQRCRLPRTTIIRTFQQSYPAGNLGRPNEAQTRRLEGVRAVRIVAPASEPALLVIEQQGRMGWRKLFCEREGHG